jgi:hypothetical protein
VISPVDPPASRVRIPAAFVPSARSESAVAGRSILLRFGAFAEPLKSPVAKGSLSRVRLRPKVSQGNRLSEAATARSKRF